MASEFHNRKDIPMEILGVVLGGLFGLGLIVMVLVAITVDREASTDFPEGGYEDRT